MPLVVNVLMAEVVALPPLHAYVLPPVAVNDTLPQPEAVPVIPAVGTLFTVTVDEADAVQPFEPVTVTE